jgi:hypothetical protein
MGDVAEAALAAVNPITVTSELTPPPLQHGEPDAPKHSQLMETSPISQALIKDLQSLLAVVGRGQSSPASSQKACIFFEAISSAAASASAFSLRRSSCLSRLISFSSWARSRSSSHCSYGSTSSQDCVYKVSTGFWLASWDACRQRSTC